MQATMENLERDESSYNDAFTDKKVRLSRLCLSVFFYVQNVQRK